MTTKTIEIKYTPNAKQDLFHGCGATEVVYGGAKGGGKSTGLSIDAIAYAIQYPGATVYLFRETYDDLEANLIAEFKRFVPSELLKGDFNHSKHQAELINGSVIKFRYIRNYADAVGYQGRSMDYIGIDELTKHEERSVQELLSCLRSAKGFPVRFRGTCNPGGVGHAWVKKRYITPTEYGKKETIDQITGNGIAFIPATVYDNDVLMDNDPAYVRRLENLPESQRKAFLHGDWDSYEGMAFEKFSERLHVVEDFPIPPHWRRWRSADNGYTDPFAWYWFAVDPQGTVYIYREFTRTYDDMKLTYTQQAERVDALSKYSEIEDGDIKEQEERIDYTVLGHDAFAVQRATTGKALVDYYEEGGLQNFVMAVTDRKIRKATWVEYLEPYEDHEGNLTSKVKIFRSCKMLIETLPLQVNDEKDTEKVAETNYDHWYDGSGYGLITYHIEQSKEPEQPKGVIASHKEKLMRASNLTGRRRGWRS